MSDRGTARSGAMAVLVAVFTMGIASGVAFLVFYWSDAGPAPLGATMAGTLIALGAGLVLWARHLMPHGEARGRRETIASNETERKAFLDDFVAGEQRIARRNVLGWMVACLTALLGAAGVSMVRSLGTPPLPVLTDTGWKKRRRLVSLDGTPVAATEVGIGNVVTVFPEGLAGSVAAQTLLIRVEKDALELSSERLAAAPEGLVAYSRVCTHAGCPVGLYQVEQHLLLCPCHQSSFDVLRGAAPTSGPAARPLPQLPLEIDEEGNLRASGDFLEPPGPGFWSLES